MTPFINNKKSKMTKQLARQLYDVLRKTYIGLFYDRSGRKERDGKDRNESWSENYGRLNGIPSVVYLPQITSGRARSRR